MNLCPKCKTIENYNPKTGFISGGPRCVETRFAPTKNAIRRRYECPHCNHKFSTRERLKNDWKNESKRPDRFYEILAEYELNGKAS